MIVITVHFRKIENYFHIYNIFNLKPALSIKYGYASMFIGNSSHSF